jgi:hypothetical protein
LLDWITLAASAANLQQKIPHELNFSAARTSVGLACSVTQPSRFRPMQCSFYNRNAANLMSTTAAKFGPESVAG